MTEYIDRKRAIVDACNSLELYPSEYAKLEDALNKIPAADVAPVVHAEWIGKPIAGYSNVRCSNCRSVYSYNSGRWNYCPNCGAIMDGGKHKHGEIH